MWRSAGRQAERKKNGFPDRESNLSRSGARSPPARRSLATGAPSLAQANRPPPRPRDAPSPASCSPRPQNAARASCLHARAHTRTAARLPPASGEGGPRSLSKRRPAALAGNRTRVNCLEGSYAHHYTTNAAQPELPRDAGPGLAPQPSRGAATGATNRRPAPAPAPRPTRQPSSAGTDRLWGAPSLPRHQATAIPTPTAPPKPRPGAPPLHRPARPSPSPQAARRGSCAHRERTHPPPVPAAVQLCSARRASRRVAGSPRAPAAGGGPLVGRCGEQRKPWLGRAERPPPDGEGASGRGPRGQAGHGCGGLRLAGGRGRAKKGPRGQGRGERPDAERRRQPPKRDVLPPRRGIEPRSPRVTGGDTHHYTNEDGGGRPGARPLSGCLPTPTPALEALPATGARHVCPIRPDSQTTASSSKADRDPDRAPGPGGGGGGGGGWKCGVCAASCLPCGDCAARKRPSRESQRGGEEKGGARRAASLSRPAPGVGDGSSGGGGTGRVRWPCSPSAGARVPSVARPQRRPPGAAGGQGPRRPRRHPARRAATRPGPPSGWPSGLRRCVQVAVSPGGVGSNPTPDTPDLLARPTNAQPSGPPAHPTDLPGQPVLGLRPVAATRNSRPVHALLRTPPPSHVHRCAGLAHSAQEAAQRLEPTGNGPSRNTARALTHPLTHTPFPPDPTRGGFRTSRPHRSSPALPLALPPPHTPLL
nr:translation initiation factor IF-2-like [Equus asinus]